MTETPQQVLDRYVADGTVPGAVALVARGGDPAGVTTYVAGTLDVEGTAPMTPGTIVRLASITKPITAACLLMLVDDGVLALDDPVDRWLPELASPSVVRTPASPVDDVVSATRPITVFDLLTMRSGYGFPADFTLPQVQELFTVQTDGREVQLRPEPEEWLARLAKLPLLHQPGEAWLYDTSSDLQGIVVARASGRTLPAFVAERVTGPLGMTDTAFEVPAAKRDRFASYYLPAEGGGLDLSDAPDQRWASVPAFPEGSGGLAGTAGDWYAFARLLLDDGLAADGTRLLAAESVRLMTTNHLTPEQRQPVELYLAGQGWGCGGSVDVERREPWNVPGRYGWVGGAGTSAHLVPSTGEVAILLTQVGVTSPEELPIRQDFWRAVAGA